MDNNINGFGPKEVVELYHYLCIYVNKLEHIRSQNVLLKQYSELKGIDTLMSSFVCNNCTRESLKTIGLVSMNNLVSMTKCRTSKQLSFLHHLRNSIAHGQLTKKGKYVELIDYGFENGAKVFSARGKVSVVTLFDIIHIINKNILL